MSIIIVFQAIVLKRSCKVLSSRNHTADDIAEQCYEMIERLKRNDFARSCYSIPSENVVCRHFPVNRPRALLPKVPAPIISQAEIDLVRILL